jgi:hypothetical protein
MGDGSIVPRTAGTPQGGVISPLLANLFLHYAFNIWMARKYTHVPFERYADVLSSTEIGNAQQNPPASIANKDRVTRADFMGICGKRAS